MEDPVNGEQALAQNQNRVHSKEESLRAFNQLVESETPSLLRLARSVLHDEEEARDLVQDALVRAYLALGDFRWESSLKHWVTRILVNQGLKKLRRRKLRLKLFSWYRTESLGSETGASPESYLAWFHSKGPGAGLDPEKAAELREKARIFSSALEELSPRQRMVVLLRYQEGLSTEEIASLMNIGKGTVKTHLVRAVHHIRARKKETEDESL
jgi:RNA polymerase sigma-70 factor (ECF subfamily)